MTVAHDGQQGLHLGLTRDWDVIVLDRSLPGDRRRRPAVPAALAVA